MDTNSKILITGAAGLVGQNLINQLVLQGFKNIIAIDKHVDNIKVLSSLHPEINIITADLSKNLDGWIDSFCGVDIVILLHAEIGNKSIHPFIVNNVNATHNVINAIKLNNVPYIIHISSSVVMSKVKDFYSVSKSQQEEIVKRSNVNYSILRPTLLFGPLDRKHLGWLFKFMKSSPFFPIPGNGKYLRQPLYVIDFCEIILEIIRNNKINKTYNISGLENVFYDDIIKAIKKINGLNTIIIYIPYKFFYMLLKIFSYISKKPPFTTQQLEALITHEKFEVIDWEKIFNVKSTPFKNAVYETFVQNKYLNNKIRF